MMHMQHDQERDLAIGLVVIVIIVLVVYLYMRKKKEGYEGPNYGWTRSDYLYGGGDYVQPPCGSPAASGHSCDIACQNASDGSSYLECMSQCRNGLAQSSNSSMTSQGGACAECN